MGVKWYMWLVIAASAVGWWFVAYLNERRWRCRCGGRFEEKQYARHWRDELKDVAAGAAFVAGLAFGVPLHAQGGAPAQRYWQCDRCGAKTGPRPPILIVRLLMALGGLLGMALGLAIPIGIIYFFYRLVSGD